MFTMPKAVPRPSESPLDMAVWETSDGRGFRWRRGQTLTWRSKYIEPA